MRSRPVPAGFPVVCALALLLAACAPSEAPAPAGGSSARAPDPATTESMTRPPRARSDEGIPIPVSEARVTRVVDGDTIDVRIGGRTERVRLIGVDTPERGQRYAADATAFTRARIGAGARVFLETDVEERDRYGRLLAYVWRSRPSSRARAEVRDRMHNAALLSEGVAVVLTIPPNVRYADVFLGFQRTARERQRGLWAPRAAGARCDPSYPDVCIPPPPPDLDCGDIEHRGFRVEGSDPHRFDGDGNGRGCET